MSNHLEFITEISYLGITTGVLLTALDDHREIENSMVIGDYYDEDEEPEVDHDSEAKAQRNADLCDELVRITRVPL